MIVFLGLQRGLLEPFSDGDCDRLLVDLGSSLRADAGPIWGSSEGLVSVEAVGSFH